MHFTLRLLLCCLLVACGSTGTSSPDSAGPDSHEDILGAEGDVQTTGDADHPDTEFTEPDATAVAEVSEAPDVPPASTPDALITADAGQPGPVDAAQPEDASGPVPVEDVSPSTPDVDEEPTTLGGGILVFELASDFVNTAGAGARLTDPVPTADPLAVHGPCAVGAVDPDESSPPLFGYDAGEITISGTSPPVTLVPVAEGADGTGYARGLSDDLETLLPAGGALLSVAGAGGADVPAFSMLVQVPEAVTLTAPGIFANVPANSDLTVSWNAGTGEVVLVTLTPLSGTFQPIAGSGLVCTIEGDPGTMVIPAAALSAVKTSGVGTVAIGVTRMRTNSANAGPWTVPAALTRSTGGPFGLD